MQTVDGNKTISIIQFMISVLLMSVSDDGVSEIETKAKDL